jgi:hypothetical protein
MDRILTRKDHEGNAVVFLPDTYHNGKIMAWYGQSNAEPVEVTIEYYKSTKDLDEKEAQRLKKQYEKVYGNGPIKLMQRFPRGLLKAIEEKETQEATVKPSETIVQGPVVPEAEKAHYRAVKAVRAGKLWELQDANGETVEIVADKAVALRSLEQQAMMLH